MTAETSAAPDPGPPPAQSLIGLLEAMGRHLGFDVATEVEASESAWVDVVWFDRRIALGPLGIRKPQMRFAPVLPVVGFEVELKTGLNAKHIKGSVSNLELLGAQVGVIVLGSGNVALARTRNRSYAALTEEEVQTQLVQRAYRYVYAEAQPRTRIVLMTEAQVVAWASGLGVLTGVTGTGTLPTT
jgi:hypothetical protein